MLFNQEYIEREKAETLSFVIATQKYGKDLDLETKDSLVLVGSSQKDYGFASEVNVQK